MALWRILITAHAVAVVAATLPAGQVSAEAPLKVEVVTATPRAEASTFTLTGTIEAHDTLSASFPGGGKIAEILVSEGDRIEKGTVLARIDSIQQEQSVRAAAAAVSSATAGLTKARDDSDRQDALLERGATTRTERDNAADQLRVAEAVLAQAEAELDLAEKALNDTVLIAPAAATVTDRLAEPGEVVGAAQPILTLALGDRLDAVFEVPEVRLTKFPEGAPPPIRLKLLDAPEVTFSGKVTEMSPLVDTRTGTIKATVQVIDPPPGLSYGDAVVGSGTTAPQERISLPFSALTATQDGPAVWVVDPETKIAALRQIEILRYLADSFILSSGLSEGEIVVTRGSSLLYTDRKVEMEPQP